MFVTLFSCLFGGLFAQSLTVMEKGKVRDVVSRYCKLLSDYTESDNYVGNRIKMLNLFPGGTAAEAVKVVNDIDTRNPFDLIAIVRYLTALTSEKQLDYRVQISYPDNIYNVDVTKFALGDEREKSGEAGYGRIKLTKRMTGELNRTTNNVFIVKLSDSKINKIFTESENSNDVSDDNTVNLWDKGGQAYAARRYEEALDYFEKGARKGDKESMYQAGYMYFAKLGCRNLSRKERNNRAYYWLSKLAAREQRARDLLDRMGYYNE